jgi:hypothetical protein
LKSHSDKPAGAVICFRAETGEVCWRFDVPDAVLTKAAANAQEGCIYFASRDQHCYCLDLAGQLRWKWDLASPVVTSPVIAGNNVYCAASGGMVYCLKALQGEVLWTFDVAKYSRLHAQLLSSPVAVDGRLYFGAALSNLTGNTAALFCLEE